MTDMRWPPAADAPQHRHSSVRARADRLAHGSDDRRARLLAHVAPARATAARRAARPARSLDLRLDVLDQRAVEVRRVGLATRGDALDVELALQLARRLARELEFAPRVVELLLQRLDALDRAERLLHARAQPT
jgi:hypothetical protein